MDKTSRIMPPATKKSATSMPRNWKTALPIIMNPKPKAKAVSIAERTVPLRCEVVMSRVRAMSMGKFPTESMATKRGMKVKPSCRKIPPICPLECPLQPPSTNELPLHFARRKISRAKPRQADLGWRWKVCYLLQLMTLSVLPDYSYGGLALVPWEYTLCCLQLIPSIDARWVK